MCPHSGNIMGTRVGRLTRFFEWDPLLIQNSFSINLTYTKMKKNKYWQKYLSRAYVLVLPKNVVKFFFKNPVTFLLVKRFDCCLYSKYSELNQKINGNDFIVMYFILNEKSPRQIWLKYWNWWIFRYGLKHYDGRSIIKF